MTLHTLIGRCICAWRERTGRKPVHNFKRRRGSGIREWTTTTPGMEKIMFEAEPPCRVCDRCGFTVPVKTRKRKAAA